MKGKPVYLDNAAATRLDERVLEAMKPYFFDTYAVATSEFAYTAGIEAREALDTAREQLAAALGASPEEFIFTSGSTESSNIALKATAMAQKSKKGNHLIIGKTEDFPVLYSARALTGQGCQTTILDVDEDGFIDIDQLRSAITDQTFLVSVQQANQEIGTIQDSAQIGALCHEKGILFHIDATHSFGRVPLAVETVQADLITISAHTIHGPRGTGGLYIRKGTPMVKWMDGGFQEFNLRAGIENIAGAIGFAKSYELITPEENKRLGTMRDHLIDRILTEIPHTTLNGHRTRRTPQNANISFHFIEGESITLHLDMRGFAVSTGSACFSRALEGSHVIFGIGGDHERAHGSIRFSLGRYNTMDEIDAAVDAITEIVAELRKISPLTEKDE